MYRTLLVMGLLLATQAGVSQSRSRADLRWTVDFPEDLAFVREVYARLYPFDPAFTSDAVAALEVNTARTPA